MLIHLLSRGATRLGAAPMAMLLWAALSGSAHAADVWRVDFAKSMFSATGNTIVLERVKGEPANASRTPGKFIVIAGDKVYVAIDGTASDASGGAARPVDYERWREMSLVQIGDRVRVRDSCGFRCQQGLADNRPMTLRFTSARGVDVRQEMRDVVVFDAR